MFRKNRQIDRTHRALQDALIALIREKPYQDIEIKEITERANTARITFYRHYATKDELLLDFLAYLYGELKETIAGFDSEHLLDPTCSPSIVLFELIEQDKDLYRRLLSSTMGMTILHQVRLYVVEEMTGKLGNDPHYTELSIGLIANHFASCIIGNICWWLMAEDGAHHYSPAEMARLTHSLALDGIKSLLVVPA